MVQKNSDRWDRMQAGRRILLLTRISVGCVVIGVIPLFFQQGRDILQDLVDGANRQIDAWEFFSRDAWLVWGHWIFFLLACVFTGLSAWHWPRMLYRIETRKPDPWVKRTFWLLTILCGMLPLVAGAAAMFFLEPATEGSGRIWLGVAVFAVVGVALLAFYLAKGHADDAVTVRNPSQFLSCTRKWMGIVTEPTLRRLDDALFYLLLLSAVVVLVLSWSPTVLARAAWIGGSAALSFAAAGFIISSFSMVAWFLGPMRLPVLIPVVGAFTLFSLFNDNHAVRRIDESRQAARPSLDAALARWRASAGEGPIILVATAGGASRAAYWTGAVLRRLDEESGGAFARRVFAISAVSGGSLGAVGYAAWTADRHLAQQQGGAACGYDAGKRLAFDRAFLGADYLSPAIAGMLYPDLLQRFLFFPFFDDRAAVLEHGWELGWRAAAEAANALASQPAGCDFAVTPSRLGDDYLDIWRQSLAGEIPWVPLVLVNGTMVENGKRVITAPVAVTTDAFEDSYDFYDLVPHPIRASTAIDNGARFPLISPAGTLVGADGARGRIVDGGYFENGGIETVHDLARFLRSAVEPEREIIIIEISNDVPDNGETDDRGNALRHPNDLSAGDERRRGLPVEAPPVTGAPVLSEITSIVGGLYGTRTARGVLAAKRLSAPVAAGIDPPVIRVTFNLPSVSERKPVLSWTLSARTRDAIDGAYGAAESGQDLTCQIAAIAEIARRVDGGARPNDARCTTSGTVGIPLPPPPGTAGGASDG